MEIHLYKMAKCPKALNVCPKWKNVQNVLKLIHYNYELVTERKPQSLSQLNIFVNKF